jgi:signal transduction histidine kinase/ligand-binding sensor domain-containing protein
MRCYLGMLLLCLLMPGLLLPVHAQSFYFKHFQVDDGLSHNSITSVLQDSKGLMWIGTRGGLNRFDGYTFKTLKDKNKELGNIGNNVINLLAEDSKGIMWIGTGKGIFKYDPFKETLTLLSIAPQTFIRGLVVADHDDLWFLSNYDLYKYDQRAHKITRFPLSANCMAIDHRKNIWLGDDDGVLTIYSPKTNTAKTARLISRSIPANLRSISKIFPLPDGKALAGCFKQGLKLYDPVTHAIRSLSLTGDHNTETYVRDISAGEKNEYWVATEDGIYIYDLIKNTSRHLRKHADDPFSLNDNAVYTVYRDNRGGMWVGTFFGGLNYYSKENARFEKYYPKAGANSISGNAVREICQDDKGDLWIGTEDAGINKLDTATGKFTNFTYSGKNTDVSYHNIHGLLAVGKQLFIGPFLHGMEIMDIPSGNITDRFKYIGDQSDHLSDFIHSIYLTRDSTLLIGTAYSGSGLFSYDRKQKTFKRIKQIPYESYVYHITEDAAGYIWTGSTAQGAFFYHPRTGQHGNVRFGDKVRNGYVNEFAVRYILQDSQRTMWFATEGGGLIRLHADRKTFQRYTTAQGLPSNVLFSIKEDNFKHLWISTLKGLACFDLKTQKFNTYNQQNGLLTDQFNYNSAFKDAKGKMYFGSVKGMIAFDPAMFFTKEASPPTYITGFQINNTEQVPNNHNGPLSHSILFTDTVILDHEQSNFSIEFAALNYSSPQVTRYKYLMRGLDKEWTYLNSNRKAFFTDLSAGEYTFVVQAESNTGSWTGQERRLFIKVLPPLWKTNTAIIIYLLLFTLWLIFSIRSYHQYQTRKNQRKIQLFEHEKEKEIYQAKIEFFTNIAHEIQTPLTLIVGPVEWLIKKAEGQAGLKKSLLMIEKNAKRLSELTGQLLDFRKTEMHQFGLNFVNTDINKLIKEQVLVFKEIAAKSSIELKAELPKGPLTAFVDREALIKIISNLISNAIKYADAHATVILADMDDTDEHFVIRIHNDGKGIPDEYREKIFEPFFRLRGNDRQGTGIGLALARSLAELHNGSLVLAANKPDATIFELRLPVHQKFEFKLSSWKKIR